MSEHLCPGWAQFDEEASKKKKRAKSVRWKGLFVWRKKFSQVCTLSAWCLPGVQHQGGDWKGMLCFPCGSDLWDLPLSATPVEAIPPTMCVPPRGGETPRELPFHHPAIFLT